MSGNEAWNRNVFRRWRKVDRDGTEITLFDRLFQMVATGKARPLTVDSLTDGTSRQLAQAERRERRPGRSATRTSWLSYDGAIPWVASYMSTAILNRTCPEPGANGGWWVRRRCGLSDAGRRWAVLPRSSLAGVTGTGRQEDRPRWHFRSPASTVPTRR